MRPCPHTAVLALVLLAGCTTDGKPSERPEPRLCLRDSPTVPLVVGDTATLETGPVGPADSLCLPAGKRIEWRSSNAAVAVVDTRGLLRALAPGRATISFSDGDESDSATYTVLPPLRDVRIVPDSVTLGVGDSATFRIVVSGDTAATPVWWYSNDALFSFARPGSRDPVPVSVTAPTVTIWATQPGEALLEAGTRYLRDAAHVRIVVR